MTELIPLTGLLKKNTSAAHARAEALLLPKLSSVETYDDYACILNMFYGYFHPVESLVARQITATIIPDIQQRRNAQFIIEDLKSLGCSRDLIPLCDELPSIDSVASALGAMYVLEGSTLGGRMISNMLMKHDTLVFIHSNLHFFNGYKEETGGKWTSFLLVVDQYEGEADQVIESANETFDCLTRWMERTLWNRS